ncbi:MAG: hypothetical protein AABX11_02460 [Nanoarchaeota archaeon]
MYKTGSRTGYGDYSGSSASSTLRTRCEGQLVASVGSRSKKEVSVERIPQINDELLGFNLNGQMVLIKMKQNDTKYDQYIGLPFTKGVTERETGRTMLIIGSRLHHIEAMSYQFNGVLWTKDEERPVKEFGDTIRWINVGDINSGFIGLDYNPSAPQTAGVATSKKDITFLASSLIKFGYYPNKRLFLLKPPYIQESQEGITSRKQGLETLADWEKLNP